MKQKIFISIFLSINFFSFSQKQNINITTIDGIIFNVKKYSSKTEYLKLIFENGSSKELPYNLLGKIEYEDKYKKETKKITEHFVRISNRNGALMELVSEGKCNFYQDFTADGNGGTSTGFYVKKNNEKIATQIGHNSFANFTNYKKITLKYFNDCPNIIENIEKKYNRKKVKILKEIIAFYNNNCL